ncbi:M1 family metallopeptidase [Olivibacter sitiensis]|uniref:M1 family metallopeptidase n=1 Tax=Olivibacter sitiensis TaxID=376470 RepID=UPI00041950E7|nr:M1 family metallopeptidase [Olivibacter sitiensis]
MKKAISLSVFLLIFSLLAAQQPYWQQKLTYNIDVSLDDNKQLLRGSETILYKNNSPDTLEYVWFHIWPNAYKDTTTALFQQILNDTSRREKLDDISYGYMDKLNFKVDGEKTKTEAHPNAQYIDVVKLLLPKPLNSGDSVIISTDFEVQLPSYFSRSGYSEGQYMVCQWYPKPAVYDKDGWHEFPYLDMGEFYSEYADYTVNITLPKEYVVGATGVLQNQDELQQYKEVGLYNAQNRDNAPKRYQYKGKGNTKTLTYHMDNVPDFAWFAAKDLVVQYDTLQLASSKIVDAFTYYHYSDSTLWNKSIDYTKDAVKYYSEVVGEYAYPTVQVVEGPKNNASGGMEYPTITLITSPDANEERLSGVIAHEVGHNWFMSMLGSNERLHTWQDEGLNSYVQFRYEAEKYRASSIFGDAIPEEVKKLPAADFQGAIYNAILHIPMDSPIDIPADEFASSEEYGLVSYVKTALWLYILEASVGQEKVDEALQNYFQLWKHRHPQPEDLKASFEQTLGVDLDGYFALLKKEGGFAP